jgi:hypothetical protein
MYRAPINADAFRGSRTSMLEFVTWRIITDVATARARCVEDSRQLNPAGEGLAAMR